MTTTPVLTHHTPIGRLTLAASERGLTRATFRSVRAVTEPASGSPAALAWLDLAGRELDAYFTGELRRFTVAVDLRRVGHPHRRILDALTAVGYGHTTTYGALAAKARTHRGRPTPGRRRDGPQPGPDHHRVPPCARRRRQAHRLRRRTHREAVIARSGGP